MENTLSAAEEILGTAVRVEDHRNWIIFWCRFYTDASREGEGAAQLRRQPAERILEVSALWRQRWFAEVITKKAGLGLEAKCMAPWRHTPQTPADTGATAR